MIAPVFVQGDEILEQGCGVPPSAHWLQISNMVFLAWHRLDPAGRRVDRGCDWDSRRYVRQCTLPLILGFSESVLKLL